jgi:hypothetical protein
LTLGTAALVGASLWMAPPAGAAEVAVCEPGTPPQQTIVSSGGPHVITVSPLNAPNDAVAYASWAAAYATCWVSEVLNNEVVDCVARHVENRPTVYIDPETLQVTIDYHEFVNTPCTV